MIRHLAGTCIVMLTVCFAAVPAVADSIAEREALAAIARDLDRLSEVVRRIENSSTGASREGTRYRFDNLRLRLTDIENSIRYYLLEVASEPSRAWRVDVRKGSAEREHAEE